MWGGQAQNELHQYCSQNPAGEQDNEPKDPPMQGNSYS